MNRRAFLTTAAGFAAPAWSAVSAPTLIDAHTHFYDPTRSQGTPWPAKDNKVLYRPVLPEEYRKLTKPFGISGTIVVEASPWAEDNQWALDLAAKEAIIVGTVGNLEPGKPDFRAYLDRLHKNPLFRGIRYGSLWGRSLAAELPKPEFVADLKALAGAGLELDTVGGPPILPLVVRLTDRVPNLRVVIDHMPFDLPKDEPARAAYRAALRELEKRPQVFAKVSEVVRRVGDRVPDNAGYYRLALDELWEVFGPDRLIYGSNWPVSDLTAPYRTVFKVVREYFATKGQEASEKYFWKNSLAAYRWAPR